MTRRLTPFLFAITLIACGGTAEPGATETPDAGPAQDATESPDDATGGHDTAEATEDTVEAIEDTASPIDDTAGTIDDTGAADATESEDAAVEPDPIVTCGLVWPSDPFHAAVYAFVAEYILNIGPIVGCFLSEYPDPTCADVAVALEDGWQGGGAADALAYAQAWVDDNATGKGQASFDLVETFQLVVSGGAVTGGMGAGEGGGGGNPAVECGEAPSLDGQDPDAYFQIALNPNTGAPGMACMTRMVEVFGLTVVAEGGLTNAQVLHAAYVLAELLDNDEDGVVDDAALLDALQAVDALFPLFDSEESQGAEIFQSGYQGQGTSAVLFGTEIDPSQPGHFGADATVEEIMHTLNHRGHVTVYPEAFGIAPGSSLLTEAMDVARGGQFLSVPSSYPAASWYHYDDETCDYGCMAIEYIYWAQVSNMGILDDPQTCAGIANEWEPCSKALLESTDALVYALITDPQYTLPQSAPDGVYDPTP